MKFLFALLFCGSCYAQSIDTTKSIMLSKQDIENINMAGENLKSAREYAMAGYGGVLIGGTITAVGFATHNQTLGFIGIGVSAIGAVLAIIPPILIGKSGKFLIKVGQ